MLLNRDEIRQNKSFDLLTDAILKRDQPRTADLFFRMVARDGRSVGDALSVVAAAEAPFVQVPSHINVRDGQNHPDQQRPYDPRPAGIHLPDAVSAGEVPAAAAPAKRLVHPRRARYLELATR